MWSILLVQIVITTSLAKLAIAVFGGIAIWEAEEGTASRLLHALSKGLVPSDLNIGHGTTSALHGLLEVGTGEFWDWVLGISIVFHGILASSLTGLGALDVGGDSLLNGKLDGALRDEAKIGTRETVGLGCDVVDVNVWRDRSLAELGLENTSTRWLVWKRNVDESVKTTWTAEGIVELLWTIGCADDEDVLLGGHAVHFWKEC